MDWIQYQSFLAAAKESATNPYKTEKRILREHGFPEGSLTSNDIYEFHRLIKDFKYGGRK